MLHWFPRSRDWLLGVSRRVAQSRFAVWILGIISFTESIIIPVPTDIILTPLVLLHRKKWLHYGLVATLTSVAGGVTAYFLGKFFFTTFGEQLFSVYALQDDFLHVQRLFDRNTFIAMLISAFTFIPYKVFAIAGGVFHINLASFIGASLLGRSLRFVAESYVMYRFGPVIGRVVYRYFSIIVGLLIVLAGIAVFFLVS